MSLLEVKNVRRAFGGLVAVDQVSFEVKAGQIKAVIGPNGAGKTTLFNIISGLLKPDTGTITFNGKALIERPPGRASWWIQALRVLRRRWWGLKPFQVAGKGISRTFQNPSLFLQMNVLENVMVGRHLCSSSGFAGSSLRLPGYFKEERAIREASVKALERVGLAHLAKAPAGALAFGQRRMLELARALATEPHLLLLDEPASGLNTKEKIGLTELIRNIRDDGLTILLVEHDMTLVMELSDDILVLHNGIPIAEGPPAVVQNDPKVISVYLGGQLEDVAAN